MRWHDVLEALATEARGSATLVSIYGEAIRMAGTKKHVVPSLDLHLISDTETELWEPQVVQWSQYCTSLADLISSEQTLRGLFVHPLAVNIGGVQLFTEYLEGVDLEAPTRDNVYARAIRIELEPLKGSLLR